MLLLFDSGSLSKSFVLQLEEPVESTPLVESPSLICVVFLILLGSDEADDDPV